MGCSGQKGHPDGPPAGHAAHTRVTGPWLFKAGGFEMGLLVPGSSWLPGDLCLDGIAVNEGAV